MKTAIFTVKRFSELTAQELYEILRLRSLVFVVEQNCPYEDPDGKDYDSLHVFLRDPADGSVDAYLRAFPTDGGAVQMGRVVTRRHGEGLGGQLLDAGIRAIIREWDPDRITIEAQCQAEGFYAKKGFRVTSEPFLEDGIPHEKMDLILKPSPSVAP